MSYDLMIVKSLTGSRLLGSTAQVRSAIAKQFPDVELDAGAIDGDGWSLELEIASSAGGGVEAIHLTPRGATGWEGIASELAASVGGVLVDCQTGDVFGAPPPLGVPEVTERYVFDFVHPLMPNGQMLGDAGEVWATIERVVGATATAPRLTGPGWTVAFALRPDKKTGKILAAHAHSQWASAAARGEVMAVLRTLSDTADWVPFDPQRNDTVDW